MFLSKPLSPK